MKNHIPIFIILLSLIPFNASAERMIFVIRGTSPPFAYEENGNIIGTDVEVVKEFCARSDIIPEFRVYPWKRAFKSLKDGDIHGIFPLLRSEEREKFLYYPSVPISSARTVVIARKKDGIRFSAITDLKNKKIGVLEGYKYGPGFDELTGLSKISANNKKHLIFLIENERVDVILDSESVFDFNCRKFGIDRNRFETVYPVRENLLYIAFSRSALKQKGELLAERFSRFMKEMGEKKEIEIIRDRYR